MNIEVRGKVTHHFVTSYRELRSLVDKLLDNNDDVYVYFYGTAMNEGPRSSQLSWCPDCNIAAPYIEKFLNTARFKLQIQVIRVAIDKQTLRDIHSPYRKDKDFRLGLLPTILQAGTVKRLEVEECGNTELLELLFEDVL